MPNLNAAFILPGFVTPEIFDSVDIVANPNQFNGSLAISAADLSSAYLFTDKISIYKSSWQWSADIG